MICLSKADEGTFRHLEYNQSPGPLAAKHTTRQDLNGISNLREHVAAGQDGDGGCNGAGGASDMDEKLRHGGQPPGPGRGPLSDTGRWLKEPSSCLAAVGLNRLPAFEATPLPPPSLAAVRGWASWLASVLAVSILMNYLTSGRSSGTPSRDVNEHEHEHDLELDHGHALSPSPLRQLTRRSNSCESNSISADEYDTALHAGALIIVWFVSTLACAFPILARRLPGLRIPQRFFFVVRHFGTGVLIATAFVHLLPTAFISLGDPCLGGFWINDYPAIPGAIALAAIFFVAVVEMVFHPARRCTSLPAAGESASTEKPSSGQTASAGVSQVAQTNRGTAANGTTLTVPMRDMQPPRRRSGSMVHSLNRLSVIEASDDETEAQRRANASNSKTSNDAAIADNDDEDLELASTHSTSGGGGGGASLSPDQKLRKERLQCVLLELGILFHSIFIGMALAVTVGNQFVILLIAIVFHRT